MNLKNGRFIIRIASGDIIVFNRYDAASVLANHYGSKIVGYQHGLSPHTPVVDFFFKDVFLRDVSFENTGEAELYIYRRGWDDDDTSTLGNYRVLSGRGVAKVMIPFMIYNDDENTTQGYSPKCDCGGAKCKLPCREWCSTRRNK